MPLAEIEYDHGILSNRHSMDAKLYIRFFVEVLMDEDRSRIEKKKCFRDVEMITIMVPGNKKEVRTREVREEDKLRFAPQYEKFVTTKESIPEGYPIADWNQINSPAMKEELKYMGFLTVEQLANCQESVFALNAGLRNYAERAKSWLLIQAERAPIEKLAAEKVEAEERYAALEAQMAEMAAAMRMLQGQRQAA